MSHRLQVLIPEPLEKRIRKAAQRKRLSTGAWVRQALEAALKEDRGVDPLERLAALGGPTGDIDQMLAEIDAGRT
jgi:hypothetical protein